MIRLSKSVIGVEEVEAVTQVLKKEFLGMGEEVFLFEKELTEFIGRPVVCVNTGTAALQLALQSIGIGQGDEVLIQSLTYVASFQAISATGATPVACEINPESLTINIEDAKKKLSNKTKAIMPVHYSGDPGNLAEIYEFAAAYGLRVIEDAAHAFGSRYNNQLIGEYGDIVCFSFDGIKNITSGEGGAIVTNDNKVIDRIKDLRLLGVKKDSDNRYQNKRTWDFDVTEQGWRDHMSNIMAAIGRAQLRKFSSFSQKRQEYAKLYQNYLSDVNGLRLLELDYDKCVPHIFIILVTTGKRDEVKVAMEDAGIQTGIHYKPNHLLSFYKQNTLERTEDTYAQMITIPLHPDLSTDDILFISNTIKSILKQLE